MAETVTNCPASIGSPCRRIDIAHWAMRRLIPARIHSNQRITAPGVTPGTSALTGFAPGTDGTGTSASLVESKLGDIILDDPAAPGYVDPDLEDLSDQVEA